MLLERYIILIQLILQNKPIYIPVLIQREVISIHKLSGLSKQIMSNNLFVYATNILVIYSLQTPHITVYLLDDRQVRSQNMYHILISSI